MFLVVADCLVCLGVQNNMLQVCPECLWIAVNRRFRHGRQRNVAAKTDFRQAADIQVVAEASAGGNMRGQVFAEVQAAV